nr:11-beta-hydroxysteroid dehydrogenase-like 4A [Tanacetum cinerariifolium]
MHAYDAIIPPQALIAPPTVLPPSLVLSLLPMFDPQDFFLPMEILPPRKQASFLSLSSIDLSTQPQAFEIGENYHGALDTSHTRNKEQIKDILNHLDEISLDYIEKMNSHVGSRVIIQQDLDKLKTELQEARAQIARHQRKQMRHNNKIALARFRIFTLEITLKDIQALNVDRMAPKRASTSAAPAMNQVAIEQLIDERVAATLEAQAAKMANTDNTNKNHEQDPVVRKCSYKEFISYQPFNFKGLEGVVGLIRRFEHIESVFSRSNFTEDCMVKFATDSMKMMEAFIGGLPRSIEGNVTASKPLTLEEAINIAQRLMDQHIAYKYAKRVASVATIAIKEPGSRLEQVADRARQLRSPDVLFVFADVSNVKECRMFVNHTIKHFCRYPPPLVFDDSTLSNTDSHLVFKA